MTKSLIEDATENANWVAPCGACSDPDGRPSGLSDNMRNQQGSGPNGIHKRGRYKGHYRSSMPVCQWCHGRGVVFLNRMCECGMPAMFFSAKEKVWNCGSGTCLQKAIWRRDGGTINGYPMMEWVGG